MEIKMMGIDFEHPKGKFCPKVIRNYYTVCCFSTPFSYYNGGEYVNGKSGDIIIHTPGVTVHQGPAPNMDKGFVNDWFHIDGEDFTRLLEKFPLPLNVAFSVNEENFFRKYATIIQNELSSNEVGTKEIIDATIIQMIIDTHRAFLRVNEKKGKNSGIKAVRNKILSNAEKDWTVKEMAALSGYGVSRFCELYQKNYGVSPMQDVLNGRINLAKKLLASGQVTVAYAAQNCGFNSINYFSKYFKKVTGCSPREYAKRINS